MATVDMSESVIKGITDMLKTFEFEMGEVTSYDGNHTSCDFVGCDRQANYYINSPVYDNHYNTVWGFSCEIHVGVLTLQYAGKFAEKKLDEEYCKVCEASAYACDCNHLEAIGAKRKVERKAYGICAVCGGETEHDWEVHVAEMKANAQE